MGGNDGRNCNQNICNMPPLDRPRAEMSCDKCQRAFTRQEHLTRHLRTHTNEKPFSCPTCRKQFSRSDILVRHQAAHEPKQTEKSSGTGTVSFRACDGCAFARVRCLGGQPCKRCALKSQECHYPSAKKRKVSPERMLPSDEQSRGQEINTSLLEIAHLSRRSEIYENQTTDTWLHTSEGCGGGPIEFSASTIQDEGPSPISSNLVPNGGGWIEGTVQRWNNHDTDLAEGEPSFGNSQSFMFRDDAGFGNYDMAAINWMSPDDLSYDMSNQDLLHLTTPISMNHSILLTTTGSGPTQTALQTACSADPPRSQRDQRTLDSVTIDVHTSDTESPSLTVSYHTDSTSNMSPICSKYYVDSAGAREPALKRPVKKRHLNIRGSTSSSHQESDNRTSAYQDISTLWVAEDTYSKIRDNLNKTFADQRLPYKPDELPSLADLNVFVQQYFDDFHPCFPLLQTAAVRDRRGSWATVLAMSAIGAAYTGAAEAYRSSEMLHECLQKVLESIGITDDLQDTFDDIIESNDNSMKDDNTNVQAWILNVIGMFHSGNQKLISHAKTGRSVLVSFFLRKSLLCPRTATALPGNAKAQRIIWFKEQSRIRIGHFIWLLDCMIAYQTDFRPQLTLADVNAPLPYSEYIWENLAVDSPQIPEQQRSPPSLREALEVLYKEKRILPNISELGKVLLIHGIYHRTWDVAKYYGDPFSTWRPSAKTQSYSHLIPSKSIISEWRNCACDVLDVLHWSANFSVAEAAGLEHPTVLHLHLARLVLLTPAVRIQDLAAATQLRFENGPSTETIEESAARLDALRWVVYDQYKARLAVLHAASVFWHVRRYSCDSVIEPFAIYLATLVVWAFSISMASAKKQGHIRGFGQVAEGQMGDEALQSRPIPEDSLVVDGERASNPIGPASTPEPSFIHLDRPCDDELVQTFVRLGHKMSAHIVRIGDICSPGAPEKILREGARLLGVRNDIASTDRFGKTINQASITPVWGSSKIYASALQQLAASQG